MGAMSTYPPESPMSPKKSTADSAVVLDATTLRPVPTPPINLHDLEAVRRGVSGLASAQRGDGGWDAGYKQRQLRALVSNVVKRSAPTDAAAQGARLIRLVTPSDERRLGAALEFLASCQHPEGGFFYEKTRFGYSPFLYTFCAQFAVQALAWRTMDAAVEDLF